MAIIDIIIIAIISALYGYHLGINHQQTTQDTSDPSEQTAKWVGLHLHDDISEDGDTLHLPLDNLPQGSIQPAAVPPTNAHGGPYYCHQFGCDEYATHASPRCRHQICHGHHCVEHCRSACCPYRPQRLYSEE